jgi:nucleoside-diphosphate-sugar epimerase
MSYRDKSVLVTGGLGFLGSNLAIRLVKEGARVTVVDSSVAGCGANYFNLAPVERDVRLLPLDIGEPALFRDAIAASDAIFNLAGEISHLHSMQFPERDLQLNTQAHLRFLCECVTAARGIRVVYASTRQVYGIPDSLPVNEDHPIRPVDFNGIHKAAACMYHAMLSRTGALDAVVLRLTNVYGPRMALNVPAQGFLSAFFRRVLLGHSLEVFGDGTQLRDPMFVDDVVEAMLRAGDANPLPSRVYNVGAGHGTPIGEIARVIAKAAGGRQVTERPFPDDAKPIDIGSYVADCSRIERELGCKASVSFPDGVGRTLEYFEERLKHYLGAAYAGG